MAGITAVIYINLNVTRCDEKCNILHNMTCNINLISTVKYRFNFMLYYHFNYNQMKNKDAILHTLKLPYY